MTPRDPQNAFTVGRWNVYPRENRLVDGDQLVSVEPRVMSVLECLASAPGRIISVDELLDRVWAGHPHGDQAVYQAIADLRKALGDDAHAPRYIETIPKRGYRLLAPVGELATAVAEELPAARTRWRLVGLSGAAMMALLLLITSTPLNDSPEVRAYDHYQVGMNYLTRRSGMQQGMVAAAEFRRAIAIDPSFARAYTGLAEVLYRQNLYAKMRSGRSRADSAAEISEEVETLLEKAIELDADLAEVFVLRGRIAEDRDANQAAESAYRAALQSEPGHTRARQGLASVLRKQRRFAEARQQLDQALALEPRNPALLFDVMYVLDEAKEFDELMQFAEHAVTTDPDSASIFLWLNRYYMALGRPDKSVSLLVPLVDDPRFPTEQAQIFSALIAAELMLGNLDAAERLGEHASRRGLLPHSESIWTLLANDRRDEFVDAVHAAATSNTWRYDYLAYLEAVAGHNGHALPQLQTAMAQPFWNPLDTDTMVVGWQPAVTAVLILDSAGQSQQARELLREIRPELHAVTADPRRRSGAYYFLAAIESINGNQDQAIGFLQQAADSGWSLHWLIDHDPAFAGIRQNPDYRRIVDRVRERSVSLQQNTLAATLNPK